MRPHPWTALLLLAAVAGFAFAAVSTYDFTAHLDRQVHGIHCSFFPGFSAAETGNTGCHVTLMSPYSSVMRSSVWGGIPISLPGMAVFAFLAFWALWLILRDRQSDLRATTFTLAATTLPLIASLVMGYISLAHLGAACKLCIGIYTSSVIAFVAAFLLWSDARRGAPLGTQQQPLPLGVLGMAFGLGVLFVVLPVSTYALSAPGFERYTGTCGQLTYAPEPQLLVPLGPQDRTGNLIEVLDPLCPSCRGFEERFSKIESAEGLNRRALLFPLDNTCNWMVGEAIHPGACAISETMFCAGPRAPEVLEWAFANQEAITSAARTDPKNGAKSMASARFPELASCIGSAPARNKLNLALRFAVKNRLQVLTPQVYVEGLRLCDEDTDLGLDFALPRLVERARTAPPQMKPAGTLPAVSAPQFAHPQVAPRPRPAVSPTPTAVAPAAPAHEPEAAPGAEPAAAPPPPAPPAPEGSAEGAAAEPEAAQEPSAAKEAEP
jgi:uncharacterized membrane protein